MSVVSLWCILYDLPRMQRITTELRSGQSSPKTWTEILDAIRCLHLSASYETRASITSWITNDEQKTTGHEQMKRGTSVMERGAVFLKLVSSLKGVLLPHYAPL